MRNLVIESSQILQPYNSQISEGEKKEIKAFKLEKHIIGCFIDNFNEDNSANNDNSTNPTHNDRKNSNSLLILQIDRVAKYMLKTIDNEQKAVDVYFYPTTHGRDHLIAQQLVIYISYLSQADMNLENMGSQLFFIISRLVFAMIKCIAETKLP